MNAAALGHINICLTSFRKNRGVAVYRKKHLPLYMAYIYCTFIEHTPVFGEQIK